MIAIDPGASGGFAFRFTDDSFGAFKMPETDREIVDLLRPTRVEEFEPGVTTARSIYLEDLVKYTGVKMPGSFMAVYASNWGFIKGVLTAFGYRIVLVKPKDWQKALGLGTRPKEMTKTEWKNKLKNKAEQLFPSIKVTLATADALLILEAARRGLIG